MKLKKQRLALPVLNNDSKWEKTSLFRHSTLFPNNIRCLICGPSNCGKTNLLLTLLIQKNGLRFKNLYIYSKSLNQSKYEYLSQVMKHVPKIGYYRYSDMDDIISPQDVKPISVIVFDDCGGLDSQNVISEFFTRGRHQNVDTFYLIQTYAYAKKHMLRDNTNLIIAFKMDDLNLKHIYDDHVNTDMSWNTFRELCSLCWSEKYGFLVIDKDKPLNNGRYRKSFDMYIVDI